MFRVSLGYVFPSHPSPFFPLPLYPPPKILTPSTVLAEACYLPLSAQRVIPGPGWQPQPCDHRKCKGSSCSVLSPVAGCAD